ncbi:MAG: GNAT family N-acetyltransferase [Homoserinimonas sp.]
MRLRDLSTADLPQLVELNNAAVPAVPTTPINEMADLLEVSDIAIGAVDETDADTLHGFLIGLRPGSGYDSENYRFFTDRGTDYFYVDRIVVAEEARGRQIGQLLYARVFDLAREEGRDEVACEVNLDPPNPGSLVFHGRLGFSEVGQQSTKGGTVRVSLMAAPVLTITDA